MTKRILSFVLVLIMLVSVLPVMTVGAEVSDANLTRHTHSDEHVCSAQCGGNVTWIAWEEGDSLPIDSGHYYLTKDVQLTAQADVAAGKDITICLNGYNIYAKASTKVAFVYGKLTVSDCTAYEADGTQIAGSVVGSTSGDGAIYGVRRGGTLVLEGGRLTGGTTTGTGGGGAVFIQKGTSAGAGGIMYMYGGEISGNNGYNGGAICLGGADSGCVYSAFYMYGGRITGNTARYHGGGLYAVNRSVLEFHGGTIEGNTVTKTAKAVYVDGQWTKLSASGAPVIDGMYVNNASNAGLKVSGLTQGASIQMTTVATDMTKIVSLASGGKQDAWSAHWITANGESVSMVDGTFVAGHYHGSVKYEAWTGSDSHNTLPTGSKNYYLVNDIIRNANGSVIAIAKGTTQRMCLNGHTITHRNPANRLYNILGNFTLEDCSAYMDGDTYVSGGITYDAAESTRTYGCCFSVQRGGIMTMDAGQIYGFTSNCKEYEDSVPVYIQGATAGSKAVFVMNGGEIHSNSNKSRGAAIKLARNITPDTANPSLLRINGGRIWGNTSTTGGAVATTGDSLVIAGGTITGNTCVGGAVQTLDQSKISISGNPTIFDNQGGNLYLAGDIVIEMGEMTGGKIGISAAKVGRIVSTEATGDPTAFFTSDDSEVTVMNKNNCLYLGAVHSHGIDGKAGELGWTKWTATDSLPSAAGNYYLENDVQMADTFTLAEDVNLCLNGKTVTAKSGKRIMAIGNGATLTITDCCESCGKITGAASSYGGAFNVFRGGRLIMYNGCLTGNAAGEEGGAVYIQAANADTAGGKFMMYGGEISGNTAKRGGAVCLAGSEMKTSQSSFAMYGGVIRDNTATSGGGIYTYQNTFVGIAGGEITGNTASSTGGGVFVHEKIGRLQVTGTVAVTGNKAGQQNNNIYLQGDAIIGAAELTEDAVLCVSAEKAERAVTGKVSQDRLKCFYSDSAYRMIEYRDGCVYLNISGEHTHCSCYHLTQGCDHTQVRWQAWESNTSLPATSGYYYLLSDVALAQRLTVPAGADVHICLNGKTVTAAEGQRHALIAAGGVLSLTDCVGTGKLTGGSNTYGGSINVNREAVFCLYGGEISGNISLPTGGTGLGGAIYVQAGNSSQAGGTVNIYGGTIAENHAYTGGAIHLAAGEVADSEPAQLNIYGGEICGNRAGAEITGEDGTAETVGGNGAAVYVGKYAAVNMTGGTITENKGLGYGGTVYLSNASASFTGGQITDNVSGKDGGAVYATSKSTLELGGDLVISNNTVLAGAGGGFGGSGKSQIKMTGGTVTGNYASQGGGAIIQSGASLTMTGGTFAGNESKAYGGAIYVNQPNTDGTLSTMYLKGGTITGNKSGNAAGGVYVNKGYMEMTGGTVSKNETANYGCGIYFMRADGKVTGGTVSGNVSGKDGAGIYVYAGAVEIGGDVKITGNTSLKGAGGGLGFTKESKSKLTGGTITGNTATNAGGIIVQGKAHLTMTGGYVANNSVKASGGGVYVNKSSMDFYGGTIAYNKSAKTGAGLFAYESTTYFGGTTFHHNEATANGGAMYISKGQAVLNGGTYRDNSSQRYGGALYFNAVQVTAKNIKVTGNYAKSGSAGMHGYGGTVTLENVLFSENKTDTAGGGLCVTKFCELTVKDSVFEKNEANNGGGILIQNWAKAILENTDIVDNISTAGTGLYIYSNVEVTVNGGQISRNISRTKLNKNGEEVGGNAAGVYLHTDTKTSSGQSVLRLNNVSICDNEAARDGGGVYVDMQMVCHLDGCTVQNNRAGGMGAGIYQNSGTELGVENCKILANQGTDQGSAIYAGSDFTLEDSVITGNKTTNGAAVYIAPARYDGHSYANATLKFGGELQIEGNEGTLDDLYMDEGTAAGVTAAGFGENTKICVQLHSGVLTNTILGKYDYEGGDLHYTLTCGDRSLTEPEYVAPAEEQIQAQAAQTKTADGGNTLLYVGVGVFALAVIAVVILLITKKKKPVESK